MTMRVMMNMIFLVMRVKMNQVVINHNSKLPETIRMIIIMMNANYQIFLAMIILTIL
jgi:hypothetical protein